MARTAWYAFSTWDLPAYVQWRVPFIRLSRRCSMESARSASRRRQAEPVPRPSSPSDYIRGEGLFAAAAIEFAQVTPEPVNVYLVAHAINNPVRVCNLCSSASLRAAQSVEDDHWANHPPVVIVPGLVPSVNRPSCEISHLQPPRVERVQPGHRHVGSWPPNAPVPFTCFREDPIVEVAASRPLTAACIEHYVDSLRGAGC